MRNIIFPKNPLSYCQKTCRRCGSYSESILYILISMLTSMQIINHKESNASEYALPNRAPSLLKFIQSPSHEVPHPLLPTSVSYRLPELTRHIPPRPLLLWLPDHRYIPILQS
ncbi:hypothetical protein VTL71DRAFT_8443 [Oculimacula yallundae]|uniref:Uncharacterized protein n=1 Tax=Oculimacula yallundae TaxID=86028 RepID=A0ABR4CXN3_9HELO